MMVTLDDSHLARFRKVVATHLGLQFDDGKADFLSDVLRLRMQARGEVAPGAYLSALESANDMRAELGAQNIHSAIAYFAPGDPGYVLDVAGAGVLNSSQNAAAAQQFVAFLVSPQGQQIITTSNSFEYPLMSGVSTSQLFTPFAQLTPAPLTIADLGDGQAAIALLQQAQML